MRNDLPITRTNCADLPACNHAMDATCPLHVLDLACGNMRFEAYLEQACPTLSLHFHTVDNCETFDLVDVKSTVELQHLDIMESLMAGTLKTDLKAPPCIASACFAFLHHVPTEQLRESLMHVLADCTEAGGLIFVSLWNFADEPDMEKRARATTQEAIDTLQLELEPGDYLLGWQNHPNLWRYCHSFSEDEADNLAESIDSKARLIRRFQADGRNGKLNTYLVFQRS